MQRGPAKGEGKEQRAGQCAGRRPASTGRRPRGRLQTTEPRLLSPAGDLGEQTESDLSKQRLRRRSTRERNSGRQRDSMAKTESPAAAGGENGQPAMQVREGHASEDSGGGHGREPQGKEGVHRRLG